MIWKSILSVIVVLAVVFAILNLSWSEPVVEVEKCVEVNRASGLIYEACYDIQTRNVLMLVRGNLSNYNLDSFNVSFFDGADRSYDLKYNIVDSRLYRFYAEENPIVLDLRLNIIKDFSAPICEGPRKLSVRYCSAKLSGRVEDSLGSGRIINDSLLEDFRMKTDDDIVFVNNKENAWKVWCESDWNCSAWEGCDGEVQRRDCEDLNKCMIPIASPETVKYCGYICLEEWKCEWSNCTDGFIIPDCEDLNKCGTSYNFPQKLVCNMDKKCVANMELGEWSDCKVDYNFADLIEEGVKDLIGTKSRIYVDKNSCVESQKETMECLVSVDIYTRKFTRCDKDFVEIYNRLDGDLIARFEEGAEENLYLNVYLDSDEDVLYCDYCFNGKMDEDEEGVDCGGSCEGCSDRYGEILFEKKHWWSSFWEWIKRG